MKILIGLLTLLLSPVYGWAYTAPNLPTEFDPGSTPTASVIKSVCASVTLSSTSGGTPILATIASGTHTWIDNQTVTISGVTGGTAANGTWVVTKVGPTTFSLNGSNGGGSAGSGGTAACDYNGAAGLQTAINAAVNGWEIQLNPAEVYVAPTAGAQTHSENGFILPTKSGSTFVVIRTFPHSSLPADGVKAEQRHRQYMAKIQAGVTNQAGFKSSITCNKGATYWWLKAIDFTMPSGQLAEPSSAMISCTAAQFGQDFTAGVPLRKTITNVTFVGSTVTVMLDIPSHGDVRVGTGMDMLVDCPNCGVTGINGNTYTITRVPVGACTGGTDCTVTFTQAGVAGTFTSGAGQYMSYSATMLPDHIVYDQLYIDGESNYQEAFEAAPHFRTTGINLSGTYQAIINSSIHVLGGSGCERGLPITGTTGPQKAMVRNNTLSGSDMVFFFGGSDPVVYGFNPQDIVFRKNVMFKRTALLQHQSMPDSNMYWSDVEGQTNRICIKNGTEMKNGQRWLFEGNVLDHTSFKSSQSGSGLHFTSRQADADVPTDCGTPPGTAGAAGCGPSTETSDITYRNNIFRYGGGCLDLIGQAGQATIYATVRGARFLYQNNLFLGCPGFGNSALSTISIGGGPTDVTFIHNTFARPVNVDSGAGFQVSCSNSECEGATDPNDIRTGTLVRLTAQDNIFHVHTSRGLFAVMGDNVYQGCSNALFGTYAPSAVWDHNIGVGALGSCEAPNGGTLATGTQIVATEAAMNFRGYATHDYCLTASSPGYHAASDGANVGVDMQALYTAIGLNYGPGACP